MILTFRGVTVINILAIFFYKNGTLSQDADYKKKGVCGVILRVETRIKIPESSNFDESHTSILVAFLWK